MRAQVVVPVVTRRQVLELVEAGRSFEQAAAELGLRPGAAYLVATGLPADGSAALGEDDLARPGALRGSTQQLANPPQDDPSHRAEVQLWMAARAARDLVCGERTGIRPHDAADEPSEQPAGQQSGQPAGRRDGQPAGPARAQRVAG